MKPVASFTGASVLQDPRTNDTYELLDFIDKVFGGELRFIGIFWGFILTTALVSGSIKSGLKSRARKSKRYGNKWQTQFVMPDQHPTMSPLLESLDEVLTREEAASHTNYGDFTLRIHFEGTGSVHDPWKLNDIPPPELKKSMIIEGEYLKFVDSCNRITMSEGIDQLGGQGQIGVALHKPRQGHQKEVAPQQPKRPGFIDPGKQQEADR